MTDANTSVDPFAIPAGDIEEPKYPLLSEGEKKLKCLGLTHTKDEAKGTEWVRILLATTEPDIDTQGRTLYPGFKFSTMFFMTPNEKVTLQEIQATAASIVKCFLGEEAAKTTSFRDIINDESRIVNQVGLCRVVVRKSKKAEFSDSNEVRRWLKVN